MLSFLNESGIKLEHSRHLWNCLSESWSCLSWLRQSVLGEKVTQSLFCQYGQTSYWVQGYADLIEYSQLITCPTSKILSGQERLETEQATSWRQNAPNKFTTWPHCIAMETGNFENELCENSMELVDKFLLSHLVKVRRVEFFSIPEFSSFGTLTGLS